MQTEVVTTGYEYRTQNLLRDMQVDPEYYTGWEHKFMESVAKRVYRGFDLTIPQEHHLNKIWEKHLRR